MNGLPILVRIAGRPVILIGDGEAAAAKARLVERAGGRIVGIDDRQARLAIVTGDDDAEVSEIVASLRARGVLVNAVDRPRLCDFTLPAIVDRSPVLIAISSGGASAGLAAALRQRIEAMVPARLGRLAEALLGARGAIRARWPGAEERRRAIGAALGSGGPLDPLAADVGAVDAWLATPDDSAAKPGQLVRIALTSADPDDLTLRGARALALADIVTHRPGVPPAILDRARADAVRQPTDAPPLPPQAGLAVDLDLAPGYSE